jgi:SAM-dependent methyltransferase
MSDWQSSGYVTQTEYTHGYYAEMNPVRARFLFTVAGLAFPKVEAACELGFGQGISVNIHAAATGVPWHGTDFNPAHAAGARELAAASGAPVRLSDDAFADYASRSDLPDFDFIALHGIWSWVSPENRRTLVDFLDRRLKPGGVVFASYNMLPGWAPMLSARQLMLRHAESLDLPGAPIAERIARAIDFSRELLSVDPAAWGQGSPTRTALERLQGQDPRYLAHEYFNRDWHPMHFDEIANAFAGAKLQFACPAQGVELIPSLNLSPQQQALVSKCPDPVTRELLVDMILDRKFRRDYWVRGLRRIDPREQRVRLRGMRFVRSAPPGSEKTQLRSPRGDIRLRPDATGPILRVLASNPGPMSLGELERIGGSASMNFDQLVQSLLLQVQLGNVALAQDDESIARARPLTRALNRELLARTRFNAEFHHLASPITGGALPADRVTCLLLDALLEGNHDAAGIARAVWDHLQSLGEKVTQDGRQLATPEENLERLTAMATEFLVKGLPVFTAFGICDAPTPAA